MDGKSTLHTSVVGTLGKIEQDLNKEQLFNMEE